MARRSSAAAEPVIISRALFDRLASSVITDAHDAGSTSSGDDAVMTLCTSEFRRLLTPKQLREYPGWVRKLLRKHPLSVRPSASEGARPVPASSTVAGC